MIFPFQEEIKKGEYVAIKINRATSATLFGDYLNHINFEKDSLALTG